MEIEYLNENNRNQWDAFALSSDTAWMRHTTAWQKYSSCCRFDSNTRNFSFMVKQGGKIQAIVPLLAEYSYPEMDFDCFAMYGDYTPLPAFANDGEVKRSSVIDAIRDEIRKIASENGIRYAKCIIDPLIESPYFRDFSDFNLLEDGAVLGFKTTNVVNLHLPEDDILRLMRKGHKSAIKQVLKQSGYRVDIFDSSNISKDKLLRFKEIHKIDAGHQTRADASWDCMYDWITGGMGILVMLWMESAGDYISGALIMTYKKAAYYASFATLDTFALSGHGGDIIQWEAIRYMKSRGLEIYEMGDNYFCLDESESNNKLREIAKYKKGFRSAEIPKFTFRLDF